MNGKKQASPQGMPAVVAEYMLVHGHGPAPGQTAVLTGAPVYDAQGPPPHYLSDVSSVEESIRVWERGEHGGQESVGGREHGVVV